LKKSNSRKRKADVISIISSELPPSFTDIIVNTDLLNHKFFVRLTYGFVELNVKFHYRLEKERKAIVVDISSFADIHILNLQNKICKVDKEDEIYLQATCYFLRKFLIEGNSWMQKLVPYNRKVVKISYCRLELEDLLSYYSYDILDKVSTSLSSFNLHSVDQDIESLTYAWIVENSNIQTSNVQIYYSDDDNSANSDEVHEKRLEYDWNIESSDSKSTNVHMSSSSVSVTPVYVARGKQIENSLDLTRNRSVTIRPSLQIVTPSPNQDIVDVDARPDADTTILASILPSRELI
jgi:hypothetical protein